MSLTDTLDKSTPSTNLCPFGATFLFGSTFQQICITEHCLVSRPDSPVQVLMRRSDLKANKLKNYEIILRAEKTIKGR